MKTLAAVVVVSMLSLSSCILEGSSCSSTSDATCQSGEAVLWCNGSQFNAFQCPGPSGCSSSGGKVSCDFRNTVAGAPCPQSGLKFCASSTKQFSCNSLRFWIAQDCSACTTDANAVTCTP